VFRKFYPSAEFAEAKGLERQWLSTGKFANNGVQLYQPMSPGLFSGKMRTVVQDHLGRGFRIPYSSTFTKTHGIFTASNGVLWLIELSASGVRAQKLKQCKKRNPDGSYSPVAAHDGNVVGDLPWVYVPTEMTDEEAKDLTVFGGEYANAYSKGALYSNCGWAFSASGAKAANVLYSYEQHPDNNLYYSKTWLYELTINEDSETNEPVSVDCSQTDGGWLYGDRVEHFKYPDADQRMLLSYDLYKGQLSGVPQDIVGTPIHCWYEGEALQRVDYTRVLSETTDEEVEGYNKYRRTTVGGAYFTSPIYTSGELDESVTGYDYTEWATEYETPGGLTEVFDGFGSRNFRGVYETREAQNLSPGIHRDSKDMVIIPLNEREGVYHLRRQTESSGYSYQLKGRVRATHSLGPGDFPNGGHGGLPRIPRDDVAHCDNAYDPPGNSPRNVLTGVIYALAGSVTDANGLQGLPLDPVYGSSWISSKVKRAAECTNRWGVVDGSYFPSAAAAGAALCAKYGYEFSHVEQYVDSFWLRDQATVYGVDEDTGEPISVGTVRGHHLGVVAYYPYMQFLVGTIENGTRESSSGSVDARGVIAGQSVDVTVREEDLDNWFLFIDPDMTTQRMVAAADQSDAGKLIYSTELSVGLGEPLHERLAGPADYPMDEVTGTYLAWVGNP
jgi:hypothetical protein